MSSIKLIKGSCADQEVDAVVNAANRGLYAGGGICGVIFTKAGMRELTYDRQKVCEYAYKWAYKRNPNYYNFDTSKPFTDLITTFYIF